MSWLGRRVGAWSLLVLTSCGGNDADKSASDAQVVDSSDTSQDARTARDDASSSTREDASSSSASDGSAGTPPAQPSRGCGMSGPYPAGASTVGELMHAGATRSYRVHVPPQYKIDAPLPVVLMFHGGGGSGRQLELSSSRMSPIADREGFIAVYPDGTGVARTWNGGGCCGAAVRDDVDDVGFVGALLDHLEGTLCVDKRRVFASGMSNGGLMSHRLGCELGSRITAIAPVSGTDMTQSCAPSRPVPVLHIHGSSDGHVPWDGGMGCGPAGVPFTSVPETIARWVQRDGCSQSTTSWFTQGDGSCEVHDACQGGAQVILCTVQGGGHSWPGGEPNVDLVACPGNGEQSTTFDASETIWRFFSRHALALP